jgi:hypothetical protein
LREGLQAVVAFRTSSVPAGLNFLVWENPLTALLAIATTTNHLIGSVRLRKFRSKG